MQMVFVMFDCLSVDLFVCGSVVNLNISYINLKF